MVESKASALGFGSIEWHDRDTDAPPVDPHGDPSYSDDWDEWASAIYIGQPGQIQLPARPAWIVEAPPVVTPRGPTLIPPNADDVYAEAAQSNDPVTLAVAANVLVKMGRPELAQSLAAKYQQLTNVPLPLSVAAPSSAKKVGIALLVVGVAGGSLYLFARAHRSGARIQ